MRDEEPTGNVAPRRVVVSPEQHAIFEAVRSGLSDEDAVLKKARDLLGRKRLTKSAQGRATGRSRRDEPLGSARDRGRGVFPYGGGKGYAD